MSNERIDLTQFEGISPAKEWGLVYPERPQRTIVQTGDGLYSPHCRADDIEVRRANMALMAAGPDLLAELKRCYKQIDLLTKAFMMAGNAGYYMTICEECDTVHYYDEHCPFICEYCGEKKCECPTSD